jgi:hypothetical protein
MEIVAGHAAVAQLQVAMHLPRYPTAEGGIGTVTREVYNIQKRRGLHMEIDAASRLAVSW